MRVRKTDADGDMCFGGSQRDYWRDAPDGVGQVVESRLHLWQGEWYLDRTEGTAYQTKMLGKRTEGSRDLTIRTRILQTPGVAGIEAYSSVLNPQTRALTVAARVETIYGVALSSGETTKATDVNVSVYEGR